MDVTDWHVIAPVEQGRDEHKAWIAKRPESDRDRWWLWKPCLTTGDGTHRRLNDVAEALTYRLAVSIGLPSAQCELASRGETPGVISRHIAPPSVELVSGGLIVFPGVAYGLASIAEALEEYSAPASCSDMTALQVFTGYLVLDAWIANTDRHGENWAVLEGLDHTSNEGPRRTLAPAFDHGSAMGSGLRDEDRARADLDRFCARGRTRHFAEGGTLLDLAGAAIDLCGATPWAERVATVQPTLWRGILADTEGLSVVASSFIDELLTRNQERVSTLCQR